MKTKIQILIALLVAFLLGAITVNLMTFPARRAYRESLQQLYLEHQRTQAFEALGKDNDLKATIHLWNIVAAGPIDGSSLFKDQIVKDMDNSFWFIIFPQLNQLVRETVDIKKGADKKIIALATGRLAAMLETVGHSELAKPYWEQTAKQLNISEENAKKTFIDLILKEKKLEKKKLFNKAIEPDRE